MVKIKDFNALIDNKPIFWSACRNKKETSEKLEMSRNDDYTTGVTALVTTGLVASSKLL